MRLSKHKLATVLACAGQVAATNDTETIQMAVLACSLFLAQHEIELSPTYGLTRRERELLVRAIRGETNAEIAEALSISPRTVAKHLEHAYAKLGVHGRREAARLIAHA